VPNHSSAPASASQFPVSACKDPFPLQPHALITSKKHDSLQKNTLDAPSRSPTTMRQIVPSLRVWHLAFGHSTPLATLSHLVRLFPHFFSRSPVALPPPLVYLAPH
jgi:hypothetical protein